MSYSFKVTGASKEEAAGKVADEFRKVVESQKVHEADADQALTAAHAFIDILADPAEGEVVNVTVNGSLGWRGEEGSQQFYNASVGISAYNARPE